MDARLQIWCNFIEMVATRDERPRKALHREPASVRFLAVASSPERAEFDSDNEERRRRLSAFLLNKRRRVDSKATRVGGYLRREGRVGRPLTQEEVAEAVDVSRQWYAALERGLSIRPSAALLDRIATFFDLRDDDRLMLFRLAIPEFGFPTQQPATTLSMLPVPTSPLARS